MAPPRTGEVGSGPLFGPEGSLGSRLRRRAIGIGGELVGFVLLTVLFIPLLIVAAIVDLVLWLRRRKPWVGVRLLPVIWWFLATEIFALAVIAAIWIRSGGPRGQGSMVRRRGVYWLRPRWARSHLGAIKVMFGLRIEIEDLELVRGGPLLLMVRHASIIDNLIPDTTIALHEGYGLRFVVKRELEALPAIDIGGRWIPTNFLNRVSDDPKREIARMSRLTEDLGSAEAVVIFPEGTRATAKKIARAKEIVRERSPELAPFADGLQNLLPPRLGGPVGLLTAAPDLDVVFCAHVGFDGYEHISDIWSGRLVNSRIKVRFWRVPAAEIPGEEPERTQWLYERWRGIDQWVGEHRTDRAGAKAAAPLGSQA